MKLIHMFVFALLAFSFQALAQEAVPSPTPSGVAVDVATNALAVALAWVSDHMAIITSVLGFIWMLIVKLVPNGSAGKVVSVMQAWTDGLARLCLGVGSVFQKLSEILAAMVKSDGILGKK